MKKSLSKMLNRIPIQEFISVRAEEMMLASKKVAHGISHDSSKITYTDRMGLADPRLTRSR